MNKPHKFMFTLEIPDREGYSEVVNIFDHIEMTQDTWDGLTADQREDVIGDAWIEWRNTIVEGEWFEVK